LRHTPSSDEAARFAEELSCEKLRPQLLALTGDLASASPPDSAGVSKDTGAETSAGAAPPSPSERVDSALGPKQRATVPPSNARWTTSSRRLEPKQHANGCAAKPACSWRASSLPPIHLGVFHHDRRVEEANQGSAPYTPSRGKMAAQSPFEAPLRPPWIRVFTFRVRG
jgi:hypothetical protein